MSNEPKKCSVDGCESFGKSRMGLCNKHYLKYKRYGDPLVTKQNSYKSGTICSHEGCNKIAITNYLCVAHNMQRKYRDYKRMGICPMCATHVDNKAGVYCRDCSAKRAEGRRNATLKKEFTEYVST